MSFSTVCSNCDARLTAPDTVEGKRVKCKKCGEAFLAKRVAEDDDEDERPAKPIRSTVKMPAVKPARDDKDSPRKSAKAARRPADDDEDEEDEEEPKPKAKKKGKGNGKKQTGSPVLLYVLIGVGALLVLGGGSVGAYYAFIKEDMKPDNQAKGSPSTTTQSATGGPGAPAGNVTVGWIDFHEADGRYRIKLPQQPLPAHTQSQDLPNGDKLNVKLNVVSMGTEAFIAAHAVLPPSLAELPPEQLLDLTANDHQAKSKGATIRSTKSITYGGFPGREVAIEFAGKQTPTVMRVIVTKDRVIMLIAASQNASPEQPRVKAFFESLKIE